jgi:ribosome-binding protein aMBF1 (putative translation factor)
MPKCKLCGSLTTDKAHKIYGSCAKCYHAKEQLAKQEKLRKQKSEKLAAKKKFEPVPVNGGSTLFCNSVRHGNRLMW